MPGQFTISALNIFEELTPDSIKCLNCYVERFAIEMLTHKFTVCSLIQSLKHPMYEDNKPLTTARIRGDRNALFMDSSRHFNHVGILGEGSFGRVTIVSLKKNPTKYYALKKQLFPKEKDIIKLYRRLSTERDALLHLKSEYVMDLKGAWIESGHVDKPDAAFLLCEMARRGSFDKLIEQLHPLALEISDFKFNRGKLQLLLNEFKNEPDRRMKGCMLEEVHFLRRNSDFKARYMRILLYYTKSIIDMVNFLHSKDIVHHDLKPENIIVTGDLKLKLADLGLASLFKPSHFEAHYKFMKKETLSATFESTIPTRSIEDQEKAFRLFRDRSSASAALAGTPFYKSPESFGFPSDKWKSYTNLPQQRFRFRRHYKHDWWSVGIILYMLYAGEHPWPGSFAILNAPITMERIHKMMFKQEELCALIYPIEGVSPTPDRLIIDPDLLDIVRPFLYVDFNRRADASMLMRPVYMDLCTTYHATDEMPEWKWNEFRATPEFDRIRRMINYFEENEEPISPQQLKEESGGKEAPKARHDIGVDQCHRLPDFPGFPLMEVSPGISATPKDSPLTRYKAATAPDPVPFLDLENIIE